MRVVELLKPFVASGTKVLAASGDDVVPTIGGGVVNGLVLAHEEDGDGGGEAAERARICSYIDMMPDAGIG